jgi:hypothetical protein
VRFRRERFQRHKKRESIVESEERANQSNIDFSQNGKYK